MAGHGRFRTWRGHVHPRILMSQPMIHVQSIFRPKLLMMRYWSKLMGMIVLDLSLFPSYHFILRKRNLCLPWTAPSHDSRTEAEIVLFLFLHVGSEVKEEGLLRQYDHKVEIGIRSWSSALLLLQEGHWGGRGALSPSGTCPYQGRDLIRLISLIIMTQHAYQQVFISLKICCAFSFMCTPQRFAFISKASPRQAA